MTLLKSFYFFCMNQFYSCCNDSSRVWRTNYVLCKCLIWATLLPQEAGQRTGFSCGRPLKYHAHIIFPTDTTRQLQLMISPFSRPVHIPPLPGVHGNQVSQSNKKLWRDRKREKQCSPASLGFCQGYRMQSLYAVRSKMTAWGVNEAEFQDLMMFSGGRSHFTQCWFYL